jgi:hypothetical protein
MKLTATTVKTAEIERGKSEAIFFDDDVPGGLRIREGGSRSFIFQYKLGDKHRRMARQSHRAQPRRDPQAGPAALRQR